MSAPNGSTRVLLTVVLECSAIVPLTFLYIIIATLTDQVSTMLFTREARPHCRDRYPTANSEGRGASPLTTTSQGPATNHNTILLLNYPGAIQLNPN